MIMENIEYDRLDTAARMLYGNINLLADKLNLTSAAIYTWKKRGVPLKAFKMLAAVGINPEYIQYGNEPMLLNKDEITPLKKALPFDAETINNFDIKSVNYYIAQDIKSAMQGKIKEIEEFYKA
jgi:hypothetical protein